MRIGTRGSPLALAQAYAVRDALIAEKSDLDATDVHIEIFTTKGDRILDRALGDVGGKGLFTQEIEDALLAGHIDIAVHSMKDMPTQLPEGLTIGAVLPREDVEDVLLSRHAGGLEGLPHGAVVGTASLRRQAQVQAFRSDLKVITFRGNVNTRLRKLEAGDVDATLLARAGLNRLGFGLDNLPVGEGAMGAGLIDVSVLARDLFLPACAQGIVGIECRATDADTLDLLAQIHHEQSYIRMVAERSFLAGLDGSCRTPIGGFAELDGDQLTLHGQVLTVDGAQSVRASLSGPQDMAEAIGRDLSQHLREEGASILATLTI